MLYSIPVPLSALFIYEVCLQLIRVEQSCFLNIINFNLKFLEPCVSFKIGLDNYTDKCSMLRLCGRLYLRSRLQELGGCVLHWLTKAGAPWYELQKLVLPFPI